jgi:hypothetical protein
MPLAAEVSESTFNLYVGALAVSGLLLAVLAITGFGASSIGERLLNALFALGFLGYAFYLYFIFEGGQFQMFYYAFVVPVLLVLRAIQGWRKRRAEPQHMAPAPAAD